MSRLAESQTLQKLRQEAETPYQPQDPLPSLEKAQMMQPSLLRNLEAETGMRLEQSLHCKRLSLVWVLA